MTPRTPIDQTSSPAEVIRAVKREVCHCYGITQRQLNSRMVIRCVAWPRQIAMALCYELLGMSVTSIGWYFHRDHSDVIYALRRFHNRCDTEPQTRATVEGIRAKINGTE